MRLIALVATLIFALDQASKWFVVQWLDLITRGEIDVVPPLLNLRMAWNRGVNFGLFSGEADATRWVLISVALVITAGVIWWARRDRLAGWAAISAGLLVGGALGNVIDRFIYGAVADFLNMSCCGIENPFSFNVADVAVFAGAIGLVIFTNKPNPPTKTKTAAKAAPKAKNTPNTP